MSIRAEDGLQMLTEDLDTVQWDIVLLTETWRAKTEEVTKLAGGNLLLGAGGARNKK